MTLLERIKFFASHDDSATVDYLGTFLTQMICLLGGVVSGIVSARLLQPTGRGEMAIIQYFPNLIGTFFCLAIPSAITLFISRYPERHAEYSTAGLRLSIVLGIAGAILFAAVAPMTLAPKDAHLAWPVALTCLAAPVIVVNPHLWAIYRGLKQYHWANSMVILTATMYPCFLIMLWLFGWISPMHAVMASLAAQAVVLLPNLWRLGIATLVRPVPWYIYQECLSQGLRYFFPVVAVTIFQMADRIILMHTTNLSELGFYAVAYGFTFPIILTVEPFVQIGFVEISGAGSQTLSVDILIRRFHMAQIVLVLACLFMAPCIRPFISYGLGKEFLPASKVAYILLAAMLLRAMSRVLENGLRAVNRNWQGTMANLISLVLLIGLSLLFVPNHGSVGFSLALLAAEVIHMTILWALSVREFGIPFSDIWGLRPKLGYQLASSVWGVCIHGYRALST